MIGIALCWSESLVLFVELGAGDVQSDGCGDTRGESARGESSKRRQEEGHAQHIGKMEAVPQMEAGHMAEFARS